MQIMIKKEKSKVVDFRGKQEKALDKLVDIRLKARIEKNYRILEDTEEEFSSIVKDYIKYVNNKNKVTVKTDRNKLNYLDINSY